MRTLAQALLLVAGGAALGVAVNLASPRPAVLDRPVHAAAESGAGACEASAIGAIPRISGPDAEALCSTCSAAFVDARPASEYEAGHIAGAVHLPPAGHPEERTALAQLAAHPTVVVYDGDATCALAEGVARRLRGLGFSDVRVLAGAWPAWVSAGRPGASGACTACQPGAEARR